MDTSDLSMDLAAERMPTPEVRSAGADSFRQDEKSYGPDSLRVSIGLLAELEVSLTNSQRALLSRDVSVIERETQEQRRLQKALAELWTSCLASTQKANSLRFNSPRVRPSIPRELRAAQLRVHHLARVQLALLGRARRSLHAFSHLIKGPSAGYGPPGSIHSSSPCAFWRPVNEPEKGPSCRA
jgi:hypothetical protein